jgi:hypothetical protein
MCRKLVTFVFTLAVVLINISHPDCQTQEWIITDAKMKSFSTSIYTDEKVKFGQFMSKRYTIIPEKDNSILLVDIEFIANIQDINAKKMMAERLEELQTYFSSRFTIYDAFTKVIGKILLNQSDQLLLPKEYRFFDLSQITLSDTTNGKNYKSVWVDQPQGVIALTEATCLIRGEQMKDDPQYWHKTVQYPNGFLGLIEIRQKILVSLIFTVPKSINLENLMISIEDKKCIPALVKNDKYKEK